MDSRRTGPASGDPRAAIAGMVAEGAPVNLYHSLCPDDLSDAEDCFVLEAAGLLTLQGAACHLHEPRGAVLTSALRSFQRSLGMPDTGLLTPQAKDALYRTPYGAEPEILGTEAYAAIAQYSREAASAGIRFSWGGGHDISYGPSLGACVGHPDHDGACPAEYTVGFDCSGFTRWAYHQVGVLLGESNLAQISNPWLRRVPASQARPGDLVFFGRDTSQPRHVGIYIGERDGEPSMAAATRQSGGGVRIDPVRPEIFLGFYHYGELATP